MRTRTVPFRWRDGRGVWCDAEGLLHLPEAAGTGPLPLIACAGYEIDITYATAWTDLGLAVLTTREPEPGTAWPHPNPAARGPQMDLALLRVARSLSIVDDARVIMFGASGGGYMTLMATAATFPLNGSFPIVPPVNLPYVFSCWFHDVDTITRLRDDGVTTTMAHPGRADMQELGRGVLEHHGGVDSPRLWAYSPLAHLERITCPVVTWVTTADSLVPFPQFGGPLAAASIAGSPAIYPIDPAVVCAGARGDTCTRTLLDSLPPEEVQYERLVVPDGTPLLDLAGEPMGPGAVLQTPERTRRWLVMAIDEGPPSEDVAHFRHAVAVDTTPEMSACLEAPVDVDQLTVAKLEQLVDRAGGRGWIHPGDDAEASDPEILADERRDVARGLRTYCSTSDAHARRFDELAALLPADRRAALPAF